MNVVRKLLCLATLLAVLNLLGCAQVQVAALRKKCDFDDDPRFEVLRGKVPLSPRATEAPPTLIELSNNSKPTPAERDAIFALDTETSACARDALEIASRMGNASMLGLFQEVRLANQNLAKLLADGQITYGQYRNNSYQLQANAQKVLGDYQRAQQIADAQSQAAAAAQISATTQSLQNFNRQPSVTTCSGLGRTISCVRS